MESTPAIDLLRTYRLQHGLTFGQLADRMTDAGYPMQMRNLHRILQNSLQDGPRETTMFKVNQFAAYLRAQQRRRQPARRLKKAARRA